MYAGCPRCGIEPPSLTGEGKLNGTASSGRAARCPGNRGGGDGNRTRVQGFAGPCLSHSATPPQGACRKGIRTFESGRRDSNPRPSPWQGDALPTEPRPRRAPWGAIRTVADPAARANSDRLPASPQVSGIFRVVVYSGHVLRDLAQRPGRAARRRHMRPDQPFRSPAGYLSSFDAGRKILELASKYDRTRPDPSTTGVRRRHRVGRRADRRLDAGRDPAGAAAGPSAGGRGTGPAGRGERGDRQLPPGQAARGRH